MCVRVESANRDSSILGVVQPLEKQVLERRIEPKEVIQFHSHFIEHGAVFVIVSDVFSLVKSQLAAREAVVPVVVELLSKRRQVERG
jgi:hypothetical protein